MLYQIPETVEIFPFTPPGATPGPNANRLVIRPGGIKFMTRLDGVTFTAEAARVLAQALLEAAKIAENK